MKTLATDGRVDRGPDLSGNPYRIVVTQEGRRRLRQAVERVDGVAGAP